MPKRLITVGHSPDPDDAFMFYALAHDKIDTGDLKFRHELQDIETLNRRALRGELEVTAVSLHAYAYLLDKYALLPSGCSMGDRYGPMVVARRILSLEQLKAIRIAVPGTMTTAFLALRIFCPDFQYEVVPFDEPHVEAAVRRTAEQQDIKAAPLIHATRVAVTGRTASPGIFEVLVLLGRERTLLRLAQLSAFLASRS